jgi:hypothetical protein
MHKIKMLLAALGIGLLGALPGIAQPLQAAEDNPVTAINILLVPDATMLRHAQANNARLLKAYPAGFTLDEKHNPHITLIQRFVRTADLEKVFAVADKIFAGANVSSMKLDAVKYYYTPGEGMGVAGIVIKPTPALIRLQQELIAAVTPFTVETGTVEAFTSAHESPAYDDLLIQYVSNFVPKKTGEHFLPHVTTGIAPMGYLDEMLAEPFESFSFSPAGAAVYQLGPYGTAVRQLIAWNVAP